MSRNAPLRFVVLMAGLALLVFASVFLLTSVFSRRGGGQVSLSRERIGVIEIKGMILESRKVVENLRRYAEDRNVKGILLRIDSPGGAVAPSQEIYTEIRRIHEQGEKKVVASFGNVAASGAYYLASAADRIVSNPGTITGSIGVIMEMSNIQGLLDKIGVESFVIKSGKFKDIGSVSRPMTDEEKRLLQSVIDDVYMQFVEDVAKARGMEVDKVKQIANGSIFSGRQALGIGLVDRLGSFQDAVDSLKELAGIEGEPSLIYERPERANWFDYFARGLFEGILKRPLDRPRAGAFFLMP